MEKLLLFKSFGFTFPRFRGFVMLVMAVALFAPLPAISSTILYTGDTSLLLVSTWNRPEANDISPPNTLSPDGTQVPFDSHEFQVSIAGSYSFFSAANTPAFWDNYLFLYGNGFDSGNPLVHVIIGNDDAPCLTPQDTSCGTGFSGFNASLHTGTNYFLVTTGFSNFDAGSFTNTINLIAADPPPTVPEPTTFSLIAVGLAFAGLWGRRQNHRNLRSFSLTGLTWK